MEKALQRSMARMQVDSLDCVQFHWWDYSDNRYLQALGHLSDLQQDGLIRRSSYITIYYSHAHKLFFKIHSSAMYLVYLLMSCGCLSSLDVLLIFLLFRRAGPHQL